MTIRLFLVLLFLTTTNAVSEKDLEKIAVIEQYNLIEAHYPSYVDYNQFGLCLRAARDVQAGTVVATADFERTDKSYIAGHPSPEYKYVALMALDKNGKPVYGRVRGKWAFCNHSCDPNCDITDTFQIVTNRAIKQGQELTTSYDAFLPNFPWPDTWNFVCLCGTSVCKGTIKGYRMDILYPKLSIVGC